MSFNSPPSGPFRDPPTQDQVEIWIADLYQKEWSSLLSVARARCRECGDVVDPADVTQAAITRVAMDFLAGKLEYRGYRSLMALVHINIVYQALSMSRKEHKHQNLVQSVAGLESIVASAGSVDPVSLLHEILNENKASLSPAQREATKVALEVDLDEDRLTAYQQRLVRQAIKKLMKLWNQNR